MGSRSDTPRHEHRDRTPEPTFGDLLNGFTLDSGRRRKPAERHEPEEPDGGIQISPAPAPPPPPEAEDDAEYAPAVVRPYAWTKGRTTSQVRFEIETMVSTTTAYSPSDDTVPGEYHSVATLCQQPRSIAEIAALLSIPLGVARVLAGDMAGTGLLAVHETASVDGESPDVALMERILSGLRKL
jgi:hypothetical protein